MLWKQGTGQDGLSWSFSPGVGGEGSPGFVATGTGALDGKTPRVCAEPGAKSPGFKSWFHRLAAA